MTGRLGGLQLIIAATAGSAALLMGALAFQHIGGLAPCEMCLWQRWPHRVAIILGLLCFLAVRYGFLRLGAGLAGGAALALWTSAGLGLYHVGVERKWWAGPSDCSAANLGSLTDMLTAQMVRCDDVPWSMLGVSMAGYNAMFSALLGAVAAAAAWKLFTARMR